MTALVRKKHSKGVLIKCHITEENFLIQINQNEEFKVYSICQLFHLAKMKSQLNQAIKDLYKMKLTIITALFFGFISPNYSGSITR